MFKDVLVGLMKERNLRYSELSAATKIPKTTISGWINAGRLPDYYSIKKLARYFEITTDELLEMGE